MTFPFLRQKQAYPTFEFYEDAAQADALVERIRQHPPVSRGGSLSRLAAKAQAAILWWVWHGVALFALLLLCAWYLWRGV